MKKKKSFPLPVSILLYIFLFLTLLIFTSVLWAVRTWSSLTMDEILFQITAPLQGTGGGMIASFIWHCAVPSAVIFILLCFFFRRSPAVRLTKSLRILLPVCLLAISIYILDTKMGLFSWIKNIRSDSDFIAENYVEPDNDLITMPEKKRNLVYIYLESMETTYSSKEYGGAFDENVIPELTELALENTSFSGEDGNVNGAYSLLGSTWTMGAMFAQTSGLPLKTSIAADDMQTQTSFFPGIRTLGDILADNGYSQHLLIGSDAAFGARDMYFSQHGNYEIEDYNYAVREKWIAPDYKVWWGFEDAKLFEFAKKELTRLAASDQPFNLTLLTVDTHFEDGYLCQDCPHTFGDNQYANVFACSSKKVAQFVKWIQEQDFYENTTIVISGDHPTMDKDFCKDVPGAYQRRVYTAYINSAVQEENPQKSRIYSTMDAFPTTLAALGAQIEGDRLGLGTNLFSDQPTLLETYGYARLNADLQMRSAFMKEKEAVDLHSESLIAATREKLVNYENTYFTRTGQDQYQFSMWFGDMNDQVKSVSVEYQESPDKEAQAVELKKEGDRFTADLDLKNWTEESVITVSVVDTNDNVHEDLVSGSGNLELMSSHGYLEKLAGLAENYAVLISVRDDASSQAAAARQQLKALGLSEDLSDNYRWSYCAVIDGEQIQEQCAGEDVYLKYTFSNGTAASLYSAGFDSGNKSSIIINGIEYSRNRSGFNIVVYNKDTGLVVDEAHQLPLRAQ